jgi:hypothetical protein
VMVLLQRGHARYNNPLDSVLSFTSRSLRNVITR